MGQFAEKYESYFDSLKAMGINLDDGQKRWYVKKHEVLQDDMKKEYPSTLDEAFEAKADGYYYASHVSAARNSKRIINLIPDPTLKVHTAWDLGFTDANSIIFFQISGREIHILDYIEGTGHSMVEYIRMIKKKEYVYGTHIAPHDIKYTEYTSGKTRYETAAGLGIHFALAPDLSTQDGIDAVKNIFPRLVFHTSDEVSLFVRRIENYSKKWDSKLELWSGSPLHDECSHACFIGETLIETKDCLKRIDSINTDDLVLTPNGYKKVNKIYKREVENLVEIQYLGNKVICTSEHKFFTNKGLLYADTLSYNTLPYLKEDIEVCQKKYGYKSKIQNIGFKENFLSQMMKNQSCTMDINIDGMGNITEQLSQKLDLLVHCIEQFTQSISEKFQKVIMSIIKMGIPKTMILQTCLPLVPMNIASYITPKKKEKYLGKQFTRQWNMLKNGMEAQKASNGIRNMQQTSILESINYQWYANYVKNHLKVKSTIRNFVRIIANNVIDTFKGLITKLESVVNATLNLKLINMHSKKHALKVVPLNLQLPVVVYDLEVEEDHCYYANGFLVSNSDALRYLAIGIDSCLDDAQGVSQTEADNLWRNHGRKI